MGVTDASVFPAVDAPNDVTIYQDFATAEHAEAFAGYSELHKAMRDAGVSGAPEIWVTRQR